MKLHLTPPVNERSNCATVNRPLNKSEQLYVTSLGYDQAAVRADYAKTGIACVQVAV